MSEQLSLHGAAGVTKRRTPRRVMMHVVDAGVFPDGKNCIEFECARCGYNTGHIYDTESVAPNKRGRPCPKCN